MRCTVSSPAAGPSEPCHQMVFGAIVLKFAPILIDKNQK